MFPQAYTLDRMTGTNPVDFLMRHAAVWPLVLPEEPVKKILAVPAGGDWATVASELREAYQSGTLGVRIFGNAVALIMDTHIQKIMHEELRKLAAKHYIGADDVLECKRAINTAIDTLPGVDAVLMLNAWPCCVASKH